MSLQSPLPLPVTVCIPVRNEETGLPACLERLSRFAEIIVIDSGSSDRTCEIAEDFGARVLKFTWTGRYPKKRNWLLLNVSISQPWVMFLDADELVDDPFCNELGTAVADSRFNGYWLRYTNYFLGVPLRHGIAQRKLALFRVGKGLYEKIDEDNWSTLDMEIHEHPIVEGAVGEIFSPIDHRDFRTLDRFLEKHLQYAKWEARRYAELLATATETQHLTKRQEFKYRNIAKWWYPWLYFAITYFMKLGFLDGGAGFSYAFYKAWYFYTIRMLILESHRVKS